MVGGLHKVNCVDEAPDPPLAPPHQINEMKKTPAAKGPGRGAGGSGKSQCFVFYSFSRVGVFMKKTDRSVA